MNDTPKSFRELARELLSSTFPRGTGMSAAEKWQIKRIAEEIYALANEWERQIEENATYLRAPYVVHEVLGPKERR